MCPEVSRLQSWDDRRQLCRHERSSYNVIISWCHNCMTSFIATTTRDVVISWRDVNTLRASYNVIIISWRHIWHDVVKSLTAVLYPPWRIRRHYFVTSWLACLDDVMNSLHTTSFRDVIMWHDAVTSLTRHDTNNVNVIISWRDDPRDLMTSRAVYQWGSATNMPRRWLTWRCTLCPSRQVSHCQDTAQNVFHYE